MTGLPDDARLESRARVRLLRWLNRRGFRLLQVMDLVSVYFSLWLMTGLMLLARPDFNADAYVDRYVWTYALVALLHAVVFYFGGLYDREHRLEVNGGLARVATMVWLTSLLIGLVSLLAPGEFLIPRSVLVGYALIGPFILAANRSIARRARLRTEGPPRILLVGSDEMVHLASQHLRDTATAVTVIGQTKEVGQLSALARQLAATDIVLLDPSPLESLYTHSLADLESAGISTLMIVPPQHSLLGLRNVGELGGMPCVLLSTHALTDSQRKLKRWMDLVVLLVTAPVTIPLTLFTACYVAVRAGRPLLFVQNRVGYDGHLYAMYKFRTMERDAETKSGPVQAARQDPRIVPGMSWVRAARLDELPQLLNVALGSMTIVGPRPERPEEMMEYEILYPGYRRRHQTLPGITGLAQVRGYYHTPINHKLGHDLHYLASWTPVVDLQIMIRTVWVLITRRL